MSNQLVMSKKDKIYAESQLVADVFEKEHFHVLRDIRELEIKATISRLEAGVIYMDTEGLGETKIDKALSLFHELSKTLAEQIRSFESKYGKFNIFDKESVE